MAALGHIAASCDCGALYEKAVQLTALCVSRYDIFEEFTRFNDLNKRATAVVEHCVNQMAIILKD